MSRKTKTKEIEEKNSNVDETVYTPIYVTKMGNYGINVVIPGIGHYRKRGQYVDEIYDACLSYDIDPSEQKFKDILSLLDDTYLYNDLEGINIRNGKLFVDGIGIPIPALLLTTFKEYLEENKDVEPLKRFWVNCNLNPNQKAIEGFFKYCRDYGIVITDMGYVLLYKSVAIKTETERNKDLARFIAEEIVRVKKSRKSPKNYLVLKDKNEKRGFKRVTTKSKLDLSKYEKIGNLDVLGKNISMYEEGATVYTDHYTRQMDIRLGQKTFIDRKQCDPDINRECSHGLHVGSYKYIQKYGQYNEKGTVILTVLVNPKDIVAIPLYDNSKIRTCEYFPCGIIKPVDTNKWEEVIGKYWESDYINAEIEEIETLVKQLPEGDTRTIARSRLTLLKSKNP